MTFPTIGNTPVVKHVFEIDNPANGVNYDFVLSAQNPKTLVIEYFTVLDSNGNPTTNPGGIITVSASHGDGIFYQLNDGLFHVNQTDEFWWPQPFRFGHLETLRVNVGFPNNAAGYRMQVSQF